MSKRNAAEAERVVVGSSGRAARGALAALGLCLFLPALGTGSAPVLLPTLAGTFAASFQEVQWVVLAYLLAITTLIVGVGRLGDLLGRRRLLLAGIALFSGASVLCAGAPTLGLLVAARGAQGLGAACMMTLGLALVGRTVPKARLGGAMGLLGTLSALGTALGPSLGGLLVAGFGWRSVFLVHVPLGFAAFLLARRHLPEDRPEAGTVGSGFDRAGTVLLALTLAAYALALTLGRGRFGGFNAALLAVAVLGLALFVRVEAGSASPLLRPAMFRDRVLGASLAVSALVSTVMMATLVVGPFHLSRALGLEAALVGLALSVGPLAAALAGWPAGRMADRFGAPRMTVAGLGGMVAGSALLSVLPTTFGVPGYLGPLVVMTLGYALFQTANNSVVMSGLPDEGRGVMAGLLNLSRHLGLMTGASAMGAVFAFASGTADMTQGRPEAIATGMRTTFAVATLLIVVALALVGASQDPVRRVLSRGWVRGRDLASRDAASRRARAGSGPVTRPGRESGARSIARCLQPDGGHGVLAGATAVDASAAARLTGGRDGPSLGLVTAPGIPGGRESR